MILADINVLIYAFRRDNARHSICKAWLEKIVAGESRFGVSPLVLSAVARITTHPRIYKEPSSIGEVFAYCDAILKQSNCEVVEPGERHWGIFTRLCTETDTRGARVSDAWFAALAIERGCTWITFDRDFARFPGLNYKQPDS
jgi:uncharacterized protein